MRTTAIIVFIILSIWSIFSFETYKIFLAARYYWGNILTSPARTISITLLTLTIAFLFTIVTYKGLILPIRTQEKKIEAVYGEFKERNIEVDSSLKFTTEYLKIYNQLKVGKRLPLKDEILKFIDNSKFFYSNLPTYFNENPDFNTCIFNMTPVTQVTALKIDNFQHTILFITHNINRPDKEINIYSYQNLPTNTNLHQILDPIFTDEILNTLRGNFEFWLAQGTGIHGSAGVAVTTHPSLNGDWLWIGVPEPFNKDNNLNNLLVENIYLRGI